MVTNTGMCAVCQQISINITMDKIKALVEQIIQDEEQDLEEGLDDTWKGRLRRAYDRSPPGPGRLERAMDEARLSPEERASVSRSKNNLDRL